ncbi:hypothetical protein VFPPC_17532 [Pochonia chlamydosporia 170]|uniref:Uncharacterized protein n=1 Tax=Pochonia chlamydosporia 170 TaxID=1380566 RepID=A0A219ASZ3_METCM|nr:hypothetical protein VFPPC_17532 [Pochonia chlamydosporia 170]OWT43305.1 hypothetical protein VFPPC_17532 [Pochonia chlamydosporia 170]
MLRSQRQQRRQNSQLCGCPAQSWLKGGYLVCQPLGFGFLRSLQPPKKWATTREGAPCRRREVLSFVSVFNSAVTRFGPEKWHSNCLLTQANLVRNLACLIDDDGGAEIPLSVFKNQPRMRNQALCFERISILRKCEPLWSVLSFQSAASGSFRHCQKLGEEG